VNDDFGVAVCGESVTEFFQERLELTVVVNLAVENDPDGSVFVVDGLMTARKIDNRESPGAESDAGVDEDALVIGSTMN
jgi:hypothetical protein